ncbi:MAG: polysaccharide biosynthesis protein, partial [Chloroflexi bacterium]|nr:polysaccharide biosynthesis protein [Chloroflexota bacterium]
MTNSNNLAVGARAAAAESSYRHPEAPRGGLSPYLAAGVLDAAAAALALVVYARWLGPAGTGALNLAIVTTHFAATLGALGYPGAISRLYEPHRARASLGSFVTVLFAATTLSALVLGGAVALVAGKLMTDASADWLPLLLAPAVVVTALVNLGLGLLRAELRALRYGLFFGFRRWLGLGFGVSFALATTAEPVVFFLGYLGAESVLTGAILWLARRHLMLDRLGWPGLWTATSYGAPLALSGLLGLLLASGDRYLVRLFAGAEGLGLYVVGYSIAGLPISLLAGPFHQLTLPLSVRAWERQGLAPTQELLSRLCGVYLVLVSPLVVGLAWAAPFLTVAVAGPRFASAASVVPAIALGTSLVGLVDCTVAGLRFTYHTGTILVVNAVAFAVNVGLNLALIPWLGIDGAAIATLIAYTVLAIGSTVAAFRYVPFVILPIRNAAGLAGGLGLLALALWLPCGRPESWAELVVVAPVGLGAYLGGLWWLTPTLVRDCLGWLGGR